MNSALVIDDDDATREPLLELARAEGLVARGRADLAEARAALRSMRPSLILMDVVLADGSGIAVSQELDPLLRLPGVLLTGHAGRDTSIDPLRLGATDHLVKAVDIGRPLRILAGVAPAAPAQGGCAAAADVADIAPQPVQVAPTSAPATGAVRQHRGYVEAAHGGTLFLDEMTEMARVLQEKLLRVLETGPFLRVGSRLPQRSDARIIAATHRVASEAVTEGKLRADHSLAALNREESHCKQFAPEARALPGRYGWPGNMRELRNSPFVAIGTDGR